MDGTRLIENSSRITFGIKKQKVCTESLMKNFRGYIQHTPPEYTLPGGGCDYLFCSLLYIRPLSRITSGSW